MSPLGAKPSIERLVREFVSAPGRSLIDQEALDELLAYVAAQRGGPPPSRRRVLDILLTTDAEVSRSLGGYPPDLRGRIHIRDLDAAQTSLVEMALEYDRARQADDADRCFDCRRAVQHGRRRLDFLLSRPNLSEAKRQEKSELREWFRVWLEAPGLFEHWVLLRRRSTSN